MQTCLWWKHFLLSTNRIASSLRPSKQQEQSDCLTHSASFAKRCPISRCGGADNSWNSSIYPSLLHVNFILQSVVCIKVYDPEYYLIREENIAKRTPLKLFSYHTWLAGWQRYCCWECIWKHFCLSAAIRNMSLQFRSVSVYTPRRYWGETLVWFHYILCFAKLWHSFGLSNISFKAYAM